MNPYMGLVFSVAGQGTANIFQGLGPTRPTLGYTTIQS